ncbi:MAG TPA: hypothetical protein DHV28_08470 [Ignavibacteriales bacterium]|nr:hypothetical protein [Ignavibacteriales bacterium]
MFYDTENSHSIINQLNKKENINLLSTLSIVLPELEDGFQMIHIPIMLTPMGVDPIPDNLDQSKFLKVDEWWNEVVMIQLNSFKRKDIILSAANQDGGAHVDIEPSKKTVELKKGVGTFTSNINGIEIKQNLSNHHFPLIRRFGYEILNSKDLISLLGI